MPCSMHLIWICIVCQLPSQVSPVYNGLIYYFLSYPDREQLQAIYSSYLKPILHRQLSRHPVWGNVSKIHALAGSMIQLFEEVGNIWLTFIGPDERATIYSRLSLSRIQRDSLKHFEISVPQHIRVERVSKIINWTTTFNKWICNLTPEVRNIHIK